MNEKMNIVLCICDQLRAFELGCYGNPAVRTPTQTYGLKLNADLRTIAEGEEQYYDLLQDPYRLHNAAADAETAAVRAELGERLRRWNRETPWMNSVRTST